MTLNGDQRTVLEYLHEHFASSQETKSPEIQDRTLRARFGGEPVQETLNGMEVGDSPPETGEKPDTLCYTFLCKCITDQYTSAAAPNTRRKVGRPRKNVTRLAAQVSDKETDDSVQNVS